MGEFQSKHKSDSKYWQEAIELYRASKAVRILLKKFSLFKLSGMTGFSKNYICGVKESCIKPSADFINKINEVLNG